MKTGGQLQSYVSHQGAELSRSRRASLTFISELLRYVVQMFVGFVVEPIIIRGLGSELYGVWSIIEQSTNYLSVADLRPAGALKLTLAVIQHKDDYSAKRRKIGASLLIWLRMLPVMIVLGLLLVIATPSVTQVSPENISQSQLAMFFAVLGVWLSGLLSIPDNVLRGSNYDYKAMGLTVLVVIIGGGLSVGAIWTGMGLAGVSAAVVATAILGGAVRFGVARRSISWFSAERPTKNDVRELFKISWWVFGSSIAYLLLNSTDLLVIGMIFGSNAAGIYAATGLALRMSSGLVLNMVSAGSPGLADLWGQRDHERVRHIRLMSQLIGLFTMTIVGVGVIILNRAFLTLWTHSQIYAGDGINLVLVLIAILVASNRPDVSLMDFMFALKQKVAITLFAGGVGIVLSFLTASWLGLQGIALSFLMAQMVFSILTAYSVSTRLSLSLWQYGRNILRITLCGMIALTIGLLLLPQFGRAENWSIFIVKSSIITIMTFLFLWKIGLTGEQRLELTQLVKLSLLVRFTKQQNVS